MSNTFDINFLIRSDLKSLEPYETHYAPGAIRLDSNENPHDFPSQVRDYIMSQVGPQFFGRYPDSIARELIADLAQFIGVDTANIIVGNGSDEIIQNIMLAFGVGKNVYITTPTFGMYGIHARVAGALPVEIPRGPGFEVDYNALIEAEVDNPGIIVICSPNNPTGNAVNPSDIKNLADSVKSLVIMDEAYIEFGGESCLPLLAKCPNLAIMRTFSKAYGLAGLRVGYMLAGTPIIKELMRIKQPFNVNSFTQMAARSVLRYNDLFGNCIKEIISQRENLVEKMRELPDVILYPSAANYIFFETGKPAYDVYCGLMERGIIIRYIPVPNRGDFLRVTVGTIRENQLFIRELKQILSS